MTIISLIIIALITMMYVQTINAYVPTDEELKLIIQTCQDRVQQVKDDPSMSWITVDMCTEISIAIIDHIQNNPIS